MLASQFRLKKNRDITRVLKRGRYGAMGDFLVKTTPNGLGESRVVVVVSKKISKKAVVRNRIRRRVQGGLERDWATLKQGYDIVINVRGEISEAETANIDKQLKQALERAGVIEP